MRTLKSTIDKWIKYLEDRKNEDDDDNDENEDDDDNDEGELLTDHEFDRCFYFFFEGRREEGGRGAKRGGKRGLIIKTNFFHFLHVPPFPLRSLKKH